MINRILCIRLEKCSFNCFRSESDSDLKRKINANEWLPNALTSNRKKKGDQTKGREEKCSKLSNTLTMTDKPWHYGFRIQIRHPTDFAGKSERPIESVAQHSFIPINVNNWYKYSIFGQSKCKLNHSSCFERRVPTNKKLPMQMIRFNVFFACWWLNLLR